MQSTDFSVVLYSFYYGDKQRDRRRPLKALRELCHHLRIFSALTVLTQKLSRNASSVMACMIVGPIGVLNYTETNLNAERKRRPDKTKNSSFLIIRDPRKRN